MKAARGWVWLHLIIAWLPIWALYTGLILSAHGGPAWNAARIGARDIATAAVLGLLVQRLTERHPWPRPLGAGFVLVHIAAAFAYALTWVGLTTALGSLTGGRWTVVAPPLLPAFVIMGGWLYLMVAGISYAVQATERAARAEAAAATTQLAALRAQLNPHFLFNAMHTVVQLIPLEPRQAARAAEQVAALLRTVIEEDRDLVPLKDERRFVERYLDVERIRFGDRLSITFDVASAVTDALIPSFALQTLVENAVRHGAGARLEATSITVSARAEGGRLLLTVRDAAEDSNGTQTATADAPSATTNGTAVSSDTAGTGLRRLSERLDALYARRASLSLDHATGRSFTATISLPMEHEETD